MQTFFRLLSLPLLALALSLAVAVLAVTATVFQCGSCEAWVVLMLPLPFGPFAVMACLGAGLSLRNAAL